MTFYDRVMRAGAPLLFTFGIILLLVQIFDAATALFTAARMTSEEPYGASISYVNLISKLVESFVWPLLVLGMAMIVDSLDARTGGEGPRK
jgi:hypothetical protein